MNSKNEKGLIQIGRYLLDTNYSYYVDVFLKDTNWFMTLDKIGYLNEKNLDKAFKKVDVLSSKITINYLYHLCLTRRYSFNIVLDWLLSNELYELYNQCILILLEE